MSDPALTELESLRKAIETNTKMLREHKDELAGFREDLHAFTEQVKVIVASVNGMGGAGAIMRVVQQFLPFFGGGGPPPAPRGRG